jgi:hypothetical protein
MTAGAKAWLTHQLLGIILVVAISLFLTAVTNTFRSDRLPWIYERKMLKAGDMFPFVPVRASKDAVQRSYLGIPEDKEMVTIDDIQAGLLVLEVLNVYCFPCQNQALALNDVYKIIETRPQLKSQIKILGVALRNTKEQVLEFKQEYGIQFPVMADPDANSEKVIGKGIYTPFSLYIRRNASGHLGLVIGSHQGAIDDREVLLNGLITLLQGDPASINFKELFKEKDKPKEKSEEWGLDGAQ